MMRDRIQGATRPGLNVTLVDDEGTPIADGTAYTWTAEAAPASGGARLWVKTTGIVARADGFDVAWFTADVGALPAVAGRKTAYVIEFTGTHTGGGVLIHQERVNVTPAVG